MADVGSHLVQGEGVVPAADNPLASQVPQTVQETVEEATQKAVEDAEAAEREADAGKAEETVEETVKRAATEAAASGDEAGGEEAGDESDAAGEEAEIGPLEPPAAWSAEDQEVFRGIGDKKVQEWVAGFAERQTAPLQEQNARLAPVAKVLGNFETYLNQVGAPADKVVEGLLQTEYLLRTGTQEIKQQALAKIVKDYGIEVGQPSAPIVPEEVADDPVAQALMTPLQEVQNQLRQLEAQMNGRDQSHQQQVQASAQAQLEAFSAEKDDKGNLKHPYYAEVLPTMEALANAANARGQQTTLAEVYEGACMADPAVRAKIQSAEKAAGIRARQASAAGKDRSSKAVSSSPGGASTETVLTPKKGESAYETAMRAWQQHGGDPI